MKAKKEHTQRVTILGQPISLIRPSVPNQPRVYKDERPTTKYPLKTLRSKTIKAHSGKVLAAAIKLYSGGIRAMKGTHADVLINFGIHPANVVSTGWMLENNNYVWR